MFRKSLSAVGKRKRRVYFQPRLEQLEDRVVPAGPGVDVWIGASPNGPNWSDGANWDTGTAPAGNDTVIFDGNVSQNSSIVDLTATNVVARISIVNNYTGTITLRRNFDVTARIDQSSGTIAIPKDVTLSTLVYSFLGGDVTGVANDFGNLTIQSGIDPGLMDVNGGNSLELVNLTIGTGATLQVQQGVTFDTNVANYGSVEWSGGTIDLENGEFDNYGSFDASGDNDFAGALSSFVNQGTFTKSATVVGGSSSRYPLNSGQRSQR